MNTLKVLLIPILILSMMSAVADGAVEKLSDTVTSACDVTSDTSLFDMDVTTTATAGITKLADIRVICDHENGYRISFSSVNAGEQR